MGGKDRMVGREPDDDDDDDYDDDHHHHHDDDHDDDDDQMSSLRSNIIIYHSIADAVALPPPIFPSLSDTSEHLGDDNSD